MKSLFYCTPSRVALPALTERLAALGLIERVDARRPMTAVVYRGEVWFSLLDAIRPCLCALIRSFDGWIGLDDGEFSTRLTLADLEGSEGSLRRVVAITSEDA
jgi:hypothetical protein